MKTAEALQIAKINETVHYSSEYHQVAIRAAKQVGVTNLDLIRAHLELGSANGDSDMLCALLHAIHIHCELEIIDS